MDGVTKARINLKEGVVELEGSESFVAKYLDEFKLHVNSQQQQVAQTPAHELLPSKGRKRNVIETNTVKKAVTPKRAVKKVKPMEFDSLGNDKKPSLQEFIKQKEPKASAAEYIAVIGYYITKVNNEPYFTEAHVEFGYRIANLGKPPLSMHQSFIDAKNKKFYVEEVEVEGVEGAWDLQRIGEQFVEHELPRKTEK